MEYLVNADWLNAHLNDPDLVVLDCTNFADWSADRQRFVTTSARDHWAEEHIPGAQLVDFTEPGFADLNSPYRNMLPDPASFAAAMAGLGVGDGKRVVLYDDAASQWATRVWWMLRWIGFDAASVLDGGWVSWEDAGFPTTDDPHPPQPDSLSVRPRPEMFTDKQAVFSALDDGTPVIDALSAVQFDGRESDLGLSGHITGAVNISGTALVNPVDDRFLPLDELASRFPWPRDTSTLLYCGSGVAAAAVGFTMLRLGYPAPTIYMPGLQEWITDPSLPMTHRPA